MLGKERPGELIFFNNCGEAPHASGEIDDKEYVWFNLLAPSQNSPRNPYNFTIFWFEHWGEGGWTSGAA